MKRFLKIFVIPLLLTGCQSCNNNQLKQPDMNQYYAWCIVPYDNQNRTPEQRIEMLKELGLKAYAYDWREQNLDEMKQELELAQKNNINIIGIWMWIDKEDAPGNLSENNQKVFRILSELQLSTQIWVSLSDAYIGDNGDEQKLENAAEMISYLSLEAEDIGSRIGLYNHGVGSDGRKLL